MSGTRELKALILMLDEHRQNIGNSQYSFPMDSEAREVLQRFSAAIPRMRPQAFRRIQELWYEAIRWAERREEVVEPTNDYVWSRVYLQRWSEGCDEHTVHTLVDEQRHIFLSEVEAMFKNEKYNRDPLVLEKVKAQGLFHFQQEEESLALWYRQKRERELLEESEGEQ